ncbi:restriction endonuclease subunit S, partial [Aliarcobacter butzleri]|uniref:restriction endonuclease subunit S n=1 Tax=Aliarcobacter butzleri TaxID=28197 RepID=UPI003B2278C8
YKEIVNPKWLEIYLNSITKKYVVAKEGNGKLEIIQMKNIPVVIPDLKEQEEIVKEYTNNQKIIDNLKNKLNIIKNQLSKNTNYKSKKFKVSDLFQITSGVRITKEEVYSNQGNTPVITSQSKRDGIAWFADRNWLKKFLKKDKNVLIDKECITWTKEGNAGKMFYRNFEFFPIDVAGVLILKDNININLKWFIFTFQNVFYSNVVSKGGQGKLYEEQMANIEIEMPVNELDEIDIKVQNNIYEEYEKLTDIKEKIESIIQKYTL